MREDRARRWIEAEVAGLDPEVDTARIVLLSTNRMLPRVGRGAVMNLLYTLGFVRVSGQLEGARVVDAVGKVHRAPERRAEATIGHFALWLGQGPDSERGRASLAEVRAVHDRIGARLPFSNETMVHTICLFTVQFELLLGLVGAPGYSEVEKRAQVAHWREIGEQLGTREMPETWDAMIEFLRWYESSPRWFGPSAEGARCARSLIRQFASRRMPRGSRWAAEAFVASLLEDHVLAASGLRRPPPAVVAAVRGALHVGLALEGRLLGDPRELLDPTELLDPGG